MQDTENRVEADPDQSHQDRCVVVLDGDAFRGPKKLKDSVIKKFKNWLALPGDSFPEKGLYEFLWSLKDDPDSWDASLGGFSSQVCFQHQTTYTCDKEQIKRWYQSISPKIRKRLLKKYFAKHDQEKRQIREDFIRAYNHVVRFHGLPEIVI